MNVPSNLSLQPLTGVIERITFYNEENGYTVARFVPEGKSYTVTVIGNLMGASVGESLALQGIWTNHPTHGRQFEIKKFTIQLPATIEGIRKYLGSGLIKGIGPVTAKRIVDYFGLDTLEVIEKDIARLNQVGGVGGKRIEIIQKGWAEQKQIKEVMMFLSSHGVSTALAVKIYKQYGDGALNVLKNEPYRLARDIYGIGFLTADKIARALGMKEDDPARIEAGVEYVLAKFIDDGHVFAERGALVDEARQALGASAEQIDAAIGRLETGEVVVVEEMGDWRLETGDLRLGTGDSAHVSAVYLTPFHIAEKNTAKRLLELKKSRSTRLPDFQRVSWEKAWAWLETQSPVSSPQSLTSKQQDAVRTALTEKVSILTGGPGTGKTTTVRAIIQLLKAKHKTFKLAAPTGRAAKRLSEATGEQAQTLHRLLEFKPFEHKKFLRDRDNPLDADLIIVDETSMIDLLLMNALLKAIDLTSHVLFVGDPDQLPSVGAGNVLKDMLASNTIPVISLDVIFRQDETSQIVSNAHRINRGEFPVFANARDFFLVPEEDAAKAAAQVIDLVTRRIRNRFPAFDAIADIQVLSPMHRGQAGVAELNTQLQVALNPPAQGKRETRHGARVFRVGDKVLQTRNNYDKQVFNGDMGRVVEIDFEEQTVEVDFEGTRVLYEFSELDELVHAFALSVHKSQGSEYRAVVLPILTQHYMLLQRNLLYTAVTRAKQLVVLVGSKKAIGIAVRNNKIAHRNTRLAMRLTTNDERGMTGQTSNAKSPNRRAEYRTEGVN